MKPSAATYYQVLRIQQHAPPERVRLAYRRLAQRYHPDKMPGNRDAQRVMAALNEAYSVLSNPEARARYDRHIETPRLPRRTMPLLEEVMAYDKAWPWYVLFGTLSFSAATVGIAVFKSLFPG